MGFFQAFNWLADRVGDGVRAVADVAGDVLRPIGDAAGDVIKGVGNAIVKVVDYGADTVRAIAKDPLPTLLSYAGMYLGIPPYITSAAITAARGGKLEDIALSAAVSYATTSFMSDTQIGADIKNYTTNQWAGDFTDSMVQNFDLPLDTAMQVYKVASSTLNSSLTGGINAALTGQSIATGISSGFVSGLAYSGTNSYFDSVNKDPNWGFSPKALELMKGATATALETTILGKKDAKGNLIDPAQAVGNYIAYASLNMAGSELYKNANKAYDNFTKATTDVDKAGSKYSIVDEQRKTKLEESEVLRTAINNDSSAYQKIIDEKYTPFKTNYDNLIAKYGKAVEDYNYIKGSYEFEIDTYNNNTIIDASTRASVLRGIREKETITLPQYSAAANALSDQANKLYADNKSMLDGLTTTSKTINDNVEKFSAIKADIGEPAGSIYEDNSVFAKINSKFSNTPLAIIDDRNTAQKLLDASNKYQTAYDAWSATKATADQSAENFTKAFAEVATRDATIDALNSGVITAKKDDDGNYVLSNGLTLNKDGTFFQDGVQQFTNAAGINQRQLDFTRMDGGQTAALGKGQVTATTLEATPLIPLEEAPPLPDNTVTEVLTNAGLVDGSRDDDLISPASSDKAFQDALDRSTTGNIATIDKPIENVLTDAGLVTDEEPPFTVEVVGSTLIPLIPLEEAPPLPDNTVTEVDLTKPDYVLDPVTITGERLPPDEEPPLIPLEEAPPLPDNTVKEVVADTPDVPVIPKTPVAPVKPTIPVKPTTPVKPTAPVVPTAPNASTAPSEQLYQTTTQTQPTTLAGINYYLDMTGADILPPKTPVNPLESLLNQSSQPISLDELLRYLRS